MNERPSAPAAVRNKGPILDVLRREFAGRRRVLEIGSGTGQHAVHFGGKLPDLTWQTSDRPEHHDGINAWIRWAGHANVLPPLTVDVGKEPQPAGPYDAVFSANTAHIMSIGEVEHMFALAGEALEDRGLLCLYGPFNVDGQFTSDSNAAFDADLRAHDPAMGIRDLDELDGFATAAGLVRKRRYAMPTNNQIVIWEKQEGEARS